jgi:hypothetical protein
MKEGNRRHILTPTATITMDSNQDEERLREEATRILRQHPKVPSDFEALVVVKADAQAVENARGTLHLDAGSKSCLCLLSPFLLPFLLLGMGCAFRNSYKLLWGLVEEAEHDIYVFGKAGFGTLSRGAVKAWTPSAGMVLYLNVSLFYQDTVLLLQKNAVFGESASSTCCETSNVRDFRTGKYQQVWFVGADDLLTLPSKVHMTVHGDYAMAGLVGMMNGMGGIPGSHATTMTTMPVDQKASALSNVQLGSNMSAEQRAQMAAMMRQQGMAYVQTSSVQY